GTVDGSIVNVALPTLMRALQAPFATIQWVVLSYLMGLTVLMLSVGRLADIIGKKRIFSLGLGVFVLGSGLCGLSPSVYWLIAFRFIQSIGAAMIVALGVAIVTETWPDAERGKAIGISGGVISLGLVAGPALGGLILQHLGWRWIFFVNLPVGALALFLVLRYVPPLVPRQQREAFDLAGAGTIGLSLASFALALTIGQEQGFTAPAPLGLLTTALVSLLLFLWIERRAAHPMLDLALFRIPTFGLNLFTGLLTFIAIAGVIFLLPFYLELVLGLSQQNTGLLMAVVPMVLGVVAPISGSLSDRLGTRPVTVVGLVLIVIGYLALSTLGTNTTPMGFVLRMLPVGLGMATFQSPNNSAIMGSAPRNRLGVASGTLSTTRTMGQTMGIAVLGAFFTARLHAHAGPEAVLQTATPEQIVRAIHDQMFLVALLIALGLVIAVRQWKVERKGRRGLEGAGGRNIHPPANQSSTKQP
ncbi:MAG: DHA2 family efflux MFS transporter permease subunit, partial [Caldilineae bacterium]